MAAKGMWRPELGWGWNGSLQDNGGGSGSKTPRTMTSYQEFKIATAGSILDNEQSNFLPPFRDTWN